MAAPAAALLLIVVLMVAVEVEGQVVGVGGGSWCVARSDASNEALQTALDYACGSGADCRPIQSDGLCFLPNTIQAHSSYAFNSYYQRKSRAPGSCDFAATATIAQTDPSYGSCVYPTSASTAGGTNIPITTPPLINPNVPTPTTTSPFYGGGGMNPGMTTPMQDNSRATLLTSTASSSLVLFWSSLFVAYLLIM